LGEVKSITNNSNQFSDLRRPLPDHKTQILLYWWMAREQGIPLWDSVSVIYANKNYTMGSPYKEYILTPTSLLDSIEGYLEEARELKQFRASKEREHIPSRTLCATVSSPRAKQCQFCNICFNMD
jgi:hypothetical protein